MAQYLPVFAPATAITLTASATITGGQLLEVSGNGTVAPAAVGSAKYVGVAAHDALANGRLTVWPRGMVHEATASGAITAGAQVVTAASGEVAALAAAAGAAAGDINNARSVIGVALTTAADDAKVRYVAF